MSPQIESLRKQFQGMNTAQKKQFIDNLKQKLAGKNNAEYNNFLAECIQDYNTNTAVNSGATKSVSVTQTQAGNTFSTNTQAIKCNKCGEMFESLQNRCPNCLTLHKSSSIIKDNPQYFILGIGIVAVMIYFALVTMQFMSFNLFSFIQLALSLGILTAISLITMKYNINQLSKRVIIIICGLFSGVYSILVGLRPPFTSNYLMFWLRYIQTSFENFLTFVFLLLILLSPIIAIVFIALKKMSKQ